MDESAKKDLKVKGSVPRSRDIGRIIVSGYNTKLPHNVAVKSLKEVFSSCGEITDVYIRKKPNKRIQSYAFINFLGGEIAVQKALELGGSDVRGRNVVVEANPDIPAGAAAFYVVGYDTGLSNDEIKSQLSEHFSSCGRVTRILLFLGKAKVRIVGDDAEDKGLDLDGSLMGGHKLVVTLASEPSTPSVHPRMVHSGNFRLDKKWKMTPDDCRPGKKAKKMTVE